VASWSGRGNLQTESFTGASGSFRITWETSRETSPGAGTFKLTLGSSISGRGLQVLVDATGAGHGVAYANEDPRTFYILIESADEDWHFSVEEGFPATIGAKD